jgi:hypothetical protein
MVRNGSFFGFPTITVIWIAIGSRRHCDSQPRRHLLNARFSGGLWHCASVFPGLQTSLSPGDLFLVISYYDINNETEFPEASSKISGFGTGCPTAFSNSLCEDLHVMLSQYCLGLVDASRRT